MKTLNLKQGSAEWNVHRLNHNNASDAPSMMAASPHKTRNELIKEYATGIAPEVDDYMRDVIWPRGHKVEIQARAIVEAQLEEDLFPTTGADDQGNSASFDGLNLAETFSIEVKQWNAEKAKKMQATGKLLPEYYWQVEHQMMVCPSIRKTLFIMTDGTEDKWVEIEYTRVRGRQKKLVDGWAQLSKDIAALKDQGMHEDPKPTPVERVSLENLPGLRIEVSESHVLASNLDVYKAQAMDYIAGINTNLQTDQDFADAEANVKFCQNAEKDLAAVKVSVANSSASITEVLSMIDEVQEQLRQKRLDLDKMVKAEKQSRKQEIILAADQELDAFCRQHENYLHGYRIEIDGSFPEAAHGLKTLVSIQSKIDDAMAVTKIEVQRIAGLVKANWDTIPEVSHDLFPDFNQIGDKHPDDFLRLVNDRLVKEREKLDKIVEQEKPEPVVEAPPAKLHDAASEPVELKPSFDTWWDNIGSGVPPAAGEDTEAFTKRIARMAWSAAKADDVPF